MINGPELPKSEARGLKPPVAGGAPVVDDQTFRFIMDLELRKAERLRYCLSLICISQGGPEDTATTLRSLAAFLPARMRGTDMLARWTPSSLVVLLVGAGISDIPAIVRRVTADLVGLQWSAGAASYPETASGGEEMMRQATEMMARAKEAGSGQLRLAC